MQWRNSLALALLVGYTCASTHAQESCGAGKDQIVHALESMRPDSSADQLIEARESLKRALDLCSDLGDAYYYRYLVEQKLGDKRAADFALAESKKVPSEAREKQLNPFVLASPATPAPAGPVRERYALVIGIGKFSDSHLDPLEYASGDAAGFADFLTSAQGGGFKPENVHSLLDGKATTRNIKLELDWLAHTASPDDLVVVYLATHGSASDADLVGAHYIVTYDTEAPTKAQPGLLFATALPMVDVANTVATRVRARRAAVFIDTCFSGAAAKNEVAALTTGLRNEAPSPDMLSHAGQGAGRIILAASKPDEESLQSDDLKHGYFTYYLLEAFRKQGGSAPLSAIFPYVQQQVSASVARDYQAYHYHQTPVISMSTEGADFALAGAPSPAASGAR